MDSIIGRPARPWETPSRKGIPVPKPKPKPKPEA